MKQDYEVRDGYARFFVQTRFFPTEILYAAAYIMLKDAYIIFDGDPLQEVIVYIKPKQTTKTPEELAVRFHDELINFSVYRKQAEQNKDLRRTFLQRALLTAENSIPRKPAQPLLDDPDEIAIPWEEKYGLHHDKI